MRVAATIFESLAMAPSLRRRQITWSFATEPWSLVWPFSIARMNAEIGLYLVCTHILLVKLYINLLRFQKGGIDNLFCQQEFQIVLPDINI